MTNLYGSKTGSPDVCARLLGEVLSVRFRRHAGDGGKSPWYVAHNTETEECLVVMANRTADGDLLEAQAPTYSILFYVDRTSRDVEISRKVAIGTSFRFLQCGEKLRSTVQRALTESIIAD